MKKLWIVLIFVSLCGMLPAQPQKDDWKINAGATFDFTKQDAASGLKMTSSNVYRLSPGVEYFVTDRLSVGLSPFWGESNMESKGDMLFSHEELGNGLSVWAEDEFYIKDIGLEAAARYYLPVARNLHLTLKGFFAYSHAKFTNDSFAYGSIDDTYFLAMGKLRGYTASYRLGITPGLSYWISPRWSVQLDVLPVFYQTDNNRKRNDWEMEMVTLMTSGDYFTPDPFKLNPGLGVPIQVTSITGKAVSDSASLERRKNDFGVNWASFSVGVSYKF